MPRAERSDDDAPCSISLRRGTKNLTSQSSSHSRRRVHETAIVRAKRIDASPRRVRRPSRPPERLAGRAFERMSRVNTIGIKSENARPRRARRRRDDDLHAPESSLGPAPYMVDIAPVRERWRRKLRCRTRCLTRWVSATSSRGAKRRDETTRLERAAEECARMKEWTNRSCNNIKALVLILVPHDSAQERIQRVLLRRLGADGIVQRGF